MLWDLLVCGGGKERHGGLTRKYVQKEYAMTDKTWGSACSDQNSWSLRSHYSISRARFQMRCPLLVSLTRGGILCTLWKAITDFRDKRTWPSLSLFSNWRFQQYRTDLLGEGRGERSCTLNPVFVYSCLKKKEKIHWTASISRIHKDSL